MRVLLSSWLFNGFWTVVVDVDVSVACDLGNVGTATNVDDASGVDDGRINRASKIWTVLDDNAGVEAVNEGPVVVPGDSEDLDLVSGI